MGLDFVCGNEYIRVGSYTTVAKLRGVLVKCTYDFIKNHQINSKLIEITQSNKQQTKELLEHLQKIMVGDEHVSIFFSTVGYNYIHNNYSQIHRLLLNHNCEGLLFFVYHSDCHGIHSVNEVKKIVKWLKNILSYDKNSLILYKNNFMNETLETGVLPLYKRFYLTEILEHSIENNEPIEYC